MEKQILQIEALDKITVIRLMQNRVYQEVVPEFKNQMLSLLDQGHNRLVVDLSRVEVMNSAGLGILILVQDHLEKGNGRMALTGLSPVLEHLFSQMKLGTLFQVAKSETEAVELVRVI